MITASEWRSQANGGSSKAKTASLTRRDSESSSIYSSDEGARSSKKQNPVLIDTQTRIFRNLSRSTNVSISALSDPSSSAGRSRRSIELYSSSSEHTSGRQTPASSLGSRRNSTPSLQARLEKVENRRASPTPSSRSSVNSSERIGTTDLGKKRARFASQSDVAQSRDVEVGEEFQLNQPAKPALQLKVERNPQRKWFGAVLVPESKATNDDAENDARAQPAVPVKKLPPSDHAAEKQPPKVSDGDFQDSAIPVNFPTTQITPKARVVDTDGTLRLKARRKILAHKHLTQATQVALNGFCIFATWWFSRYYYILLPLITATVALNVAMVFSIIIRKTWNTIIPEKIIMPENPESMILLVPCYNETKEELTKSLDSLLAQQKISDHKQAIVIICDGKVRGPGMEKTTGDYLLQDILVHKTDRKYIAGAYTAWDQQPMDIVVQRGTYGDLPYYCIVKQQNQGKRDGLIVVRSFLYNFNRRNENPKTVFSPNFFNDMASFVLKDAKIDNVTHLVGMDADTVFADDCVYELLQQSRYPQTVGVCGFVAVDWASSNWNLWRLYQSAEYTIAQGLRRLHQSLVTHKVSCLPGCCQLLRICEETCGDRVLLDLFGYCPEITDGLLKQIRATASEDRNHVCHMLTARPQSQTRQALAAKAFTDVPRSWSVFLSQRRRWTLGATSNDLLLVTAPGVQWFERILAAVNVLTWFLNPFIFASVASFIFAITVVPAWIIMCFVSVMLIPIAYYLAIPVWLCKAWRERVQFWAGCAMYIFCGPFINIFVLVYALIYMDSFGWGKTRKVISEDSASSTENELERLEKKEQSQNSSSIDVPTAGPPTNGENQRIRLGDVADEEKGIK